MVKNLPAMQETKQVSIPGSGRSPGDKISETLISIWKICLLLLGRKTMANLDSILKSRDFTLLPKVRLVKAIVFPVVMYASEGGP